MNPIAQAVHNVAEGHEERHGVSGQWRVYAENGLVYFENMAHDEPCVVVCTVTGEVE